MAHEEADGLVAELRGWLEKATAETSDTVDLAEALSKHLGAHIKVRQDPTRHVMLPKLVAFVRGAAGPRGRSLSRRDEVGCGGGPGFSGHNDGRKTNARAGGRKGRRAPGGVAGDDRGGPQAHRVD
jgi:hypothetical protein